MLGVCVFEINSMGLLLLLSLSFASSRDERGEGRLKLFVFASVVAIRGCLESFHM